MKKASINNWAAAANNSKLSQLIFGFLILALGIAVRVNFVSNSGYPMNDGGFFYSMTDDLVKNNFLVPEFSSYNNADIPYAYPPLAFYLIGITHVLSGVSLLSLFKYVPLIVSCLTIPVFYLLTKRFFEERIYRLFAVYIFATLPRSFEWFLMGGGATRSLGFLFAMLSVYFLWEAFECNKFNSNWIWGSVFSALTVLSHPLSAVFLAFSVLVMFVYHYPVNLKYTLIYGVILLIASSPWWVSTLIKHGLTPFLGASNTGHFDWFEIKNLFTLNFGYENPYFLQIVSVLAIFGIFSKKRKISLVLGILCLVGYLAIPRGGADYLTAYLPVLATFGFIGIVEPWNIEASVADGTDQFPPELKSNRSRALLLFIFVYVLLGAYSYKYVYGKANLRLNDGNFQAMIWLRENTDETDAILVIPVNQENRFWWNDYISEWLPAISDRKSLITVQGYEWKPDIFQERITTYWSLRNCSLEFACIDDWQHQNNLYPDLVYFDDLSRQRYLVNDFFDSGKYSVIFEKDNVMILENLTD